MSRNGLMRASRSASHLASNAATAASCGVCWSSACAAAEESSSAAAAIGQPMRIRWGVMARIPWSWGGRPSYPCQNNVDLHRFPGIPEGPRMSTPLTSESMIATYTGLTELKSGLPAAWYYDQKQYERELARVWYRNWVYV